VRQSMIGSLSGVIARYHLIESQLIGLRMMCKICVWAGQLAFSLWASEQGLRSIAPTEQQKC
jgi:hypothetical protein